MHHVDLMGRPIKPGDYIAYSAVDGRSGTLRVGQVIELTYAKEQNYFTKVKEPKVFVRSWSNFEERGPERSGRQKNVTLSFLDRLMVIPPEMVSEKIKADLAGPLWEHKWNGDDWLWIQKP